MLEDERWIQNTEKRDASFSNGQRTGYVWSALKLERPFTYSGVCEREGGSGREIGKAGGRVASFSMWAQGGMHPEFPMGKRGTVPHSAVQGDPAQAKGCPHRDTTELMEL